MIYTKSGEQLTEQFESCKLMPYKDVKGVYTDGWGNTHNVLPGKMITQAQADAQLLINCDSAVTCVNTHIKVVITQNEFNALVDLVFNIGSTNFANSTLLKKLNLGDFDGAVDEFKKWDQSGGKVYAGLLRRRIAEAVEFKAKDV